MPNVVQVGKSCVYLKCVDFSPEHMLSRDFTKSVLKQHEKNYVQRPYSLLLVHNTKPTKIIGQYTRA
jgi:hypothetical protein